MSGSDEHVVLDKEAGDNTIVAIRVPGSLGNHYILNAVLLAFYPPVQRQKKPYTIKVGKSKKTVPFEDQVMAALEPRMEANNVAPPVFGDIRSYLRVLRFLSREFDIGILVKHLQHSALLGVDMVDENVVYPFNSAKDRWITIGYKDDGTLYVLAKQTPLGYQTVYNE